MLAIPKSVKRVNFFDSPGRYFKNDISSFCLCSEFKSIFGNHASIFLSFRSAIKIAFHTQPVNLIFDGKLFSSAPVVLKRSIYIYESAI